MPSKLYPFRISTTLTALFMILSATFTRQLVDFTTFYIGKNGFKNIVVLVFITSSTVFFIAEARRLAHPLRICVMLALLVLVLSYSWQIKLPAVRMHIIMYAVVGWMASRDATKPGTTWKRIVAAWLFAAIAGTFEELLQKLLPYRFFDVNDIIYNVKGATAGVALYLIRIAGPAEVIETLSASRPESK